MNFGEGLTVAASNRVKWDREGQIQQLSGCEYLNITHYASVYVCGMYNRGRGDRGDGIAKCNRMYKVIHGSNGRVPTSGNNGSINFY